MTDYYGILGVPVSASGEKIKKAYRTLSLQHHPDRPGGDVTQFQKINDAYEVLGDPQKKQMYDLQKSNPLLGALGGALPQEDFLKMFFGGVGLSPPQQGQGVPFGNSFFPAGARVHIFQNGRPVHMGVRMQKPAPIIKSIEISLVQAYTGVNVPVEVERWIYEEKVKKMEKERVYIDIHAGIDDNEMVILRDQGNIMENGLRGDIKIFIKITNNSAFQRDGLNLLYTKKITLKEALVGFTFDLKHLSGKVYTINNTNGKVIHPLYMKVVPHMGMRRERSHPASPIVGDLVIQFEIKFPSHLSTEQRDKLVKIL